MKDFDTSYPNTWCPGCSNNIALEAIKEVFADVVKSGFKKNNLVAITDIGCVGKFYDRLNMNSFYSLHGRTLVTALGIKMANPNLKVVGFLGDGGAYAEGANHLIQISRLNPDLTALVFNNRVFALTVGQATPVTEVGYRGNTTPEGSKDNPYNPLSVALSAGATFIARASAFDPNSLKRIIKAAMEHHGFSLVEVIQPCLTFRPNDFASLRQNQNFVSENQKNNYAEARRLIDSWNYDNGQPPLGIFYEVQKSTWGEKRVIKRSIRRNINKKILEKELL